jgi:hypothetical protein
MPKTLAVKENNMSSPFSKNFMNKKSSLFMTEKQEDTFGPEGSNPNPEIYKGIQENESSPLEYSQAVATGYVSTRGSFQDMFDKISAGTVKAIEGLRDPETQANRLQDRIDSRKARAAKGKTKLSKTLESIGLGAITPDYEKKVKNPNYDKDKAAADSNYKVPEEINKYDLKTAKLKTRQEGYQDRSDKAMQERIEQARALRSASTKYSEDFGKNAKAGYDSIFGAGAWDKATEEEKRNFIK